MRKLVTAGLAALLVGAGAMLTGCGKSATSTPPTMDVPKEGPIAAGSEGKGGAGGAKGGSKIVVPDGKANSSD